MNNEQFESCIKEFINNINSRTEDWPLSEDTIRYMFFTSFINKLDVESYAMELPLYDNGIFNLIPKYSSEGAISKRLALDSYFRCKNGVDYAFEFKFHKRIKTSTSAKPYDAGHVINDMNRLAMILPKDNRIIEKYVIYVCDDDMKKYYKNSHEDNLLRQIFCLDVGEMLLISEEKLMNNKKCANTAKQTAHSSIGKNNKLETFQIRSYKPKQEENTNTKSKWNVRIYQVFDSNKV